MVVHSPTGQGRLEEKLKDKIKDYRRILQKVNKRKVKILCTLSDEGCVEAGSILHQPSRLMAAPRCHQCIGCHTLRTEGACKVCPNCIRSQGCVEHSRLCFSWEQTATSYIQGSVVSSVASAINLVAPNLTKYRELLEQLEEVNLEVEAVLDDFPATTEHHSNDRYNKDCRDRDLSNEQVQLHVIENLLEKYKELQARLHDVTPEEGEEVAELDSLDSSDVRYGLLSATSTLHLFDPRHQEAGGVTIEDVGPEDRTTVVPVSGEAADEGLGLGEGGVYGVAGRCSLATTILHAPAASTAAW